MENEEILQFTKIPDDTNYWFVRASKGARYYKDFMINNFIAVASITNLNFISQINISNISKKNALKLYKKYFNKYIEDTIKNDAQYQEAKTEEKKKKIKSQKLSRSTTLSRINYSFINEMKTGDIIIVPGRSAAKFLIGIVVSDCFDNKINHKFIPNKYKKQSYEECYFKLKRRVYWIKEITNDEFPDKMYSITNTHQSILNILNYADNINPLISSNFIYKGNYFTRINVKTLKNINSNDLYYFQKLLHITSESINVEINQKTKVQSPGDVILFVQNHWEVITIIIGLIFGKVEIGKSKIKGILPGIQSFIHKRKENKIKESIENEKLKQEKIKTEIIKNIQEQFEKDRPHIDKLNLDNNAIGIELEPEKQMENLKPYMEKCEKTKQKESAQEKNDETKE